MHLLNDILADIKIPLASIGQLFSQIITKKIIYKTRFRVIGCDERK